MHGLGRSIDNPAPKGDGSTENRNNGSKYPSNDNVDKNRSKPDKSQKTSVGKAANAPEPKSKPLRRSGSDPRGPGGPSGSWTSDEERKNHAGLSGPSGDQQNGLRHPVQFQNNAMMMMSPNVQYYPQPPGYPVPYAPPIMYPHYLGPQAGMYPVPAQPFPPQHLGHMPPGMLYPQNPMAPPQFNNGGAEFGSNMSRQYFDRGNNNGSLYSPSQYHSNHEPERRYGLTEQGDFKVL